MSADMTKLRESGTKEIHSEVRQMREQLFKLRWQAVNGQAENPRKIRQVRRDIARHLTVLTERSRAEAERARADRAAAQENQG